MTNSFGSDVLSNVSRETIDKLTLYLRALEKWNPKINLVSRSTIADAWTRHFQDSAQLLAFAPETARHWADLGTGGGFPGMVVAILAAEARPDLQISLIESDQRKAAFLRHVARETDCAATVCADRIEAVAPLMADVISARALAPLPALCALVARHAKDDAVALLQKGESHAAEVANARKSWDFDLITHTSVTDISAVILAMTHIRRIASA